MKNAILVGLPFLALVVAAVLGRSLKAPAPGATPANVPGRQAPAAPNSSRADLLSLLRPERDAVCGEWKREGGALFTPDLAFARARLPAEVPAEYDLVVRVSRLSGSDSLNLGLVGRGRQFVIVIDGWEAGDSTGIDLIEKRPFFYNETTFRGRLLPRGETHLVRCSVRADGVRLRVDEKLVVNWKGSFEKLGLYREWEVGDGSVLFLGSFKSQFRLDAIDLEAP